MDQLERKKEAENFSVICFTRHTYKVHRRLITEGHRCALQLLSSAVILERVSFMT